MRTIKVSADLYQGFGGRTKVSLLIKQDIMNTILLPVIGKKISEVVYFHPAISIIMPFEPKMGLKKELVKTLNKTVDKVERLLIENYPDELSIIMVQKLNNIFDNLNFGTHTKSIAVYLCPVMDKVLYMDIPVDQKITVDESFEMRDVLYCKKQNRKYLALLLGTEEMSVYLGNSDKFVKIVSNTFSSPYLDKVEFASKVPGDSWMPGQSNKLLNALLVHIDNTMGILLHAYPLPLFILGAKDMLKHFKAVTKHMADIVEYVTGEYENTTPEQFAAAMKPYIADWRKVIQAHVLNQMRDAAKKNKLVVGIKDIWRAAMKRNGRLLIMERNYRYSFRNASVDDIIHKAVTPYSKFSYIKNAVDSIIEKVLENGGDVEFLDKGLLKNYHHMALIRDTR